MHLPLCLLKAPGWGSHNLFQIRHKPHESIKTDRRKHAYRTKVSIDTFVWREIKSQLLNTLQHDAPGPGTAV
jgi:hypothetical protein